MSVVVKGMEMPTDCSSCVFKTVIGVDHWKCKASGEEFYAWDVGWGDKTYIRHSSCPLENLPSAQKTGKWIEDNDRIIAGHCSLCGWNAIYDETDVLGMPYCPNCGARMERE